MMEVVQLGFHAKTVGCYFCRIPFREGDQVRTHPWKFYFRWPKQRKKAKGNTQAALMVHVECAAMRAVP